MSGAPAIKLHPGVNAWPSRVVALRRTGPITFARVIDIRLRRARGRALTLGIATALLGGVRAAAAQEGAAVGAQVGYSRADLTGENANLVESRQGAVTGVYLHLPINPVVSIRPEVLFSLRGGRTQTLIAGGEIAEVDVELAYLELPVLARLTLPRGQFRPAVFGGPSVSLQIGCDFLFTVQVQSFRLTCGETADSTVGEVEGVREWDFGWIAGAALEMHLPRTTLALQGRYSAGFRSVLEGPVNLRNRGVALLFGLTF